MNTVSAVMQHSLMRQVGWALLHSLWQGALVGMVFALLRFALRRCSANTRYVAGCLCLALLAALPVVTLLNGMPAPPGNGAAAVMWPASASTEAPGSSPTSHARAYAGNGRDWGAQGGADFLARLAPSLAGLWVLGVVIFSVRLLKSALVEVPTVIGWVRPVILLPAATLTGLDPRQLETILAHELAHVRRLDYVVNAFQCLVETLMF